VPCELRNVNRSIAWPIGPLPHDCFATFDGGSAGLGASAFTGGGAFSSVDEQDHDIAMGKTSHVAR
jgi:hypothetical protein